MDDHPIRIRGRSLPRAHPRNDNQAAQGTALAEAIEHLLAELGRMAREACRAFDAIVSELAIPSGFVDIEPHLDLDDILESGLLASLTAYVQGWRERLGAALVDDVLDLVVFSMASTLGQRLRQDTGDTRDDPCCDAEELLARLDRFALHAGGEHAWNAQAAARYLIDELAIPARLLARTDSGALVVHPSGAMDAITEILTSVGCGILALLLDRDLPVPPRTPRWKDRIDGPRLGRSFERALADDALVTTIDGGSSILTECIMSRDATWLLVHDDAPEPARPSTRIDCVDHATVRALMDDNYPPVAPVEPRYTLMLPSSRDPVRIALRRRDDDEALLVIGPADTMWRAWLIPTALSLAGTIAIDDPALRPAIDVAHLYHTPFLVEGDCAAPLLFVRRHGIDVLDVRRLLGRAPRRPRGMRVPGVEPAELDALYSMSRCGSPPGSYLVATSRGAITVFASQSRGGPWWQHGLVARARLSLRNDARVVGVARDLIVFVLSPGTWAFVPMHALVEPDHPLHHEACAHLAAATDAPALPSWVRFGEPHDVWIDDAGLISVTFADSPWTYLYQHGQGPMPRQIGFIRGMDRSAKTAHVRLGTHGSPLLVRAGNHHLEYRVL